MGFNLLVTFTRTTLLFANEIQDSMARSLESLAVLALQPWSSRSYNSLLKLINLMHYFDHQLCSNYPSHATKLFQSTIVDPSPWHL